MNPRARATKAAPFASVFLAAEREALAALERADRLLDACAAP